MYLQAAWKKFYKSIQQIKDDLNISIPNKYEGWVETEMDTLYVQFVNDGYLILCWNEPKVRERIASYLGHNVINRGKKKVK
jgi:hypothetical protein